MSNQSPEDNETKMLEAHKHTLNHILYSIPPWVKKDPNFHLSEAKSNIFLLHRKYHEEILSFTKWAEIDPKSIEMD